MKRTSNSASLVFLFTTCLLLCHGRIPWLISEDEEVEARQVATRCYFSGNFYNVGTTFNPSLTPFGLLPCMSCTCNQSSKFGFIKPRVTCVNIRNSCPATSCADPVNVPGDCCPTCHDEFIGILTPKDQTHTNTSCIARIHIVVARESLRINLDISGLMSFNRILLKAENDVVKKLSGDDSSLGRKDCLKASIDTASFLRSINNNTATIEVELENGKTLVGYLVKHKMFSEVPFLALLASQTSTTRRVAVLNGGTLGASVDETSNSIHMFILIHLQKIRQGNPSRRIYLTVRILKRPWKADKVSVLIKSYTIVVQQNELGPDGLISKTLKWKSPRQAQLRWLVRGILFVTVETFNGRENEKLLGRLLIQRSCTSFFSVLSGGGLQPSRATSSSGSIMLSIEGNTKIRYKVAGKNIPRTSKTEVTVLDKSGNILKKLATIRRHPDEDTFEASGVWEKPSAAAISLLFRGAIHAHVKGKGEISVDMGGRIKQFLYMYSVDYSKGFLLSGQSIASTLRTQLSASVLFYADKKCDLHYLITLGGHVKSSRAHLTTNVRLVVEGLLGKKAGGGDGIELATLNSNFISRGVFVNPTDEMLNLIASGMAFVKINTRRFAGGELKGQTKLALSLCKKIKVEGNRAFLERSLAAAQANIGVCLHQGRFYDNSAKWHPYSRNGERVFCRICRCQQRQVTCSDVLCPKLDCNRTEYVEEKCCPVCTDKPQGKITDIKKACTVGFAKRSEIRREGEAWHPLVEPFGIIKCVVCVCKRAPDSYKCSRVVCPKVNCKTPVKDSALCCPQCPGSLKRKEIQKSSMSDGKTIKSKKSGCTFSGELYPHGSSWRPRLPLFGVLHCVHCRCKNGRVKCRRQKCYKSPRCRTRKGRKPRDPCCKYCIER